MMNKPLISDEALTETALLLFTCSSVGRYVRIARTSTATQDLRRAFRTGIVYEEMLIERAVELWQSLVGIDKRDSPEVELAVILGALAHSASERVSELFERFAISDISSVAWISALSRQLIQERPVNQDIRNTITISLRMLEMREALWSPEMGKASFNNLNWAFKNDVLAADTEEMTVEWSG